MKDMRFMRHKFYRGAVLLVFCFFMLTIGGCWDSKDINEKAIGTSVIIDKQEGIYYIYFEIANIEASSGSTDKTELTEYIYLKSQGKTIAEARENLDHQVKQPIYLSAIRTLILTERFASEDLVEYLYRLRDDETYRKKTVTIITDEEPESLLDAAHLQNFSVGIQIDDLLNKLDEQGESFSRTTLRVLENLTSNYTGFLLPCIGLQDDILALKGFSVVKDTKVTGFIPTEESKGIVYMKADNVSLVYTVPYKEVVYTIGIEMKKRKVKPSYMNDQMKFDLEYEVAAQIKYGNKKLPYNLEEPDLEKMEQVLSQIIEDEILTALEVSQKTYQCDYLQFDDEFRIKYPNEFRKMDFATAYLEASFIVNVKVKLKFEDMMDYGTYTLK